MKEEFKNYMGRVKVEHPTKVGSINEETEDVEGIPG